MIQGYIVDPFLRQLQFTQFTDMQQVDRALNIEQAGDRAIDRANDHLRTCLQKGPEYGTWYFYCMECNKVHAAHGLGFIYGMKTILRDSEPADMPLMSLRAFRTLVFWDQELPPVLKAAMDREDQDRELSQDIDTLLALLQREMDGDILQ